MRTRPFGRSTKRSSARAWSRPLWPTPPSPRAVTTEQAADLAAIADGRAKRAGLFVDPDDATLDRVLAAAALDLLQLHGSETPARVQAIRQRTGVAVMKVIRVAEADDVGRACGCCDACRLRREGFAAARLPDVTRYC